MIKCNDRPNFVQYDGQGEAQRAYLILDKDNRLTTDYTSEIGVGSPADVFSGLTLRWEIDNRLTHGEIDQLIKEVTPQINVIIENSEIGIANGNQTRILNETARDVDIALEFFCETEFLSQDFESCGEEECEYCNTEW